MGGFAGEGETTDVHGLRNLHGGKYRSKSNQRKHDLLPQRRPSRIMKCATPVRYCICVEVKRSYVNTALDVRLDTTFTKSS